MAAPASSTPSSRTRVVRAADGGGHLRWQFGAGRDRCASSCCWDARERARDVERAASLCIMINIALRLESSVLESPRTDLWRQFECSLTRNFLPFALLPPHSLPGTYGSDMVQATEDYDDLPLAIELDFDPSTSRIDLRLFEHTEQPGQAPIPLELAFTYNPETPFAPRTLSFELFPLPLKLDPQFEKSLTTATTASSSYTGSYGDSTRTARAFKVSKRKMRSSGKRSRSCRRRLNASARVRYPLLPSFVRP